MVDLRSATYTSSYTSGTLTVARPPTMVSGDFLVVCLIALSQYYGSYCQDRRGPTFPGKVIGSPPPGWGFGTIPPSGPSDENSPHEPPVAVLDYDYTSFAMPWTSTDGTGHGYVGSYWSNLGTRRNDGTYDTSGLATWPFQRSWLGPRNRGSRAGDACALCMASITLVGRYVDGSEPATLSFTLNLPHDSDYDYRGMALCFTPDDVGGNYYDNPVGGGLGVRYLDGYVSSWPTTSSRAPTVTFDSLSPHGRVTFAIGAGEYAIDPLYTAHHYGINLRDLDAYLPLSNWSSWPPDPTYVVDPGSPVLSYSGSPPDALSSDDLILHLIAYAGPTSYGDPTAVVVSDFSASPPVSPLPVLHQEVWIKGPNWCMLRLSQTRPTPNHAVGADGSGIVTIASPFVAPEGPITLPPVTFDSAMDAEQPQIVSTGLAMTFRVRSPYPTPVLTAVPSRLATIVG